MSHNIVLAQKILHAGFSLFVFAVFAHGQQAKPAGTRYLTKPFADVDVQRDVRYKETTDYTGKKITLELDVYQPKGDKAKSRAAIIWVHGGSLSMGSKEGGLEKQFAESFARRGYVTLNINYRLRPNPDADFNGTMMDAMTDVQSALTWLRTNAAKYRIDKAKVILAGYSAGAEMITNLCYTNFVKGMDRKQVFAIVDIAGNTLFYSEPFKDSPPCLIVHGTKDTINPFSASENLKERLLKMEISCELFAVKGSDHFFNGPGAIADIEDAITKFLFKKVTGGKGP